MSRKNRNKFKNKYRAREENRGEIEAPVTSSASAAVASAPAKGMSGAFAQHAAEYRTINADLIRLIVLNGIMLAAVFALYYANKSSGIVEKLFHQLVN